MGYADLTAVRRILDLEQLDAAAAAVATSRLEALDAALSRDFDTRAGRTWSGAMRATRQVWAGRAATELLPLPDGGITALTGVVVAPTWNGSAWVAGTPLALTEVAPDLRTPDGAYLALRHAYGWRWAGPVLVTGTWADAAAPPAEVVEALTFVVAEEYKAEKASPEALIGPDGMQVSTRNPWRFERVQAALDRWRVQVI